MQIFLFKDPSSQPGDILAHVHFSASDDPVQAPTYSHSFRFKVPSGRDGEIIVYSYKDADYKDVASTKAASKEAASKKAASKDVASNDVNRIVFLFYLEECNNPDCHKKYCQKKHKHCEKKIKDCEVCKNEIKHCKKINKHECPEISGKNNRLLVADVFHTMPTSSSLQYFGTALFKALFSGGAERLLQVTEPTDPHGGIFLHLRKHNSDLKKLDGDLDAIPWEYAKVDDTMFLVLQRKFVRVLAREHGDPPPQRPPRIVVVAPDPLDLSKSGYADLHLSDQTQNFINEFCGYSIELMLEHVLPATVNKMNLLLANDRDMATVLHFMGHCVALEDKSTRGLLFEDEESFKFKVVDTYSLITNPEKLRLAFLSACNTREIARDLVQQGVWQTIGSYCPIPDDIARNSEAQFYHFLAAEGLPVDEAMWRTRKEFQDSNELRKSDYFAGAMILYSTACQTTKSILQCKPGKLTIERNIVSPNNIDEISTSKHFFGRKKQLTDLNGILRRMATRANDSTDICTITGIGGQGKTALAMEAIHLAGRFFPGGIFVWQFYDGEEISAIDYLRSLVNVLFPNDVQNNARDVRSFGKAVSKQFWVSTLLFLDHADALECAAAENKEDAVILVEWLQGITSEQDTVKILATAQEVLGWSGEEQFFLDGFGGSDVSSGCRLFIENLHFKTKAKMQKDRNSRNLLRELVIRMDGHPLSLKLLGNAAGLPEYLDKSLEDIVHEHCNTMLADADVNKELKGHFKTKIDKHTEMERSLLYMCSLFDGPITAEILALVRYLMSYNGESVGTLNCSTESIVKILEQLCKDGYLSRENDAYKIHTGFREGLRQHNNKLSFGVGLPNFGLVETFLFGIPSKRRESNVLEWQLRNMQNNSDNAVERTFGIQYHDIVTNPDASNHELKMSFRGLVVFICETLENLPVSFAELSAQQIKPIVEKRELPFILCFKRFRSQVADKTIEIKNLERNILLKSVVNALRDNLRATHVIIRTEPLPGKLSNVSNINTITKGSSAKTISGRKLASDYTYGDFVGREKELDRLKELLDDNKIRYITILGFGGMGKTTLAIQAVRNFDSGRVLMLSFVKMPSFSSMVSKIAEFLRIDINNSKNSKADVLEKLKDENTVLFYLDNLETLQQAAESNELNMETERNEAQFIKRFFNEIPINVKILATSRTVIGWPEEYLITLTGLKPQDGMQVFRQWTSQRSNDFNDEDAMKISDVINGHPLSIRLLGGVFNKGKRPINEFINNIREHFPEAKGSLDQHYDSVNTCIHYSYDYLNENQKYLLGQLRRFNIPFSATLVSKALRNNTTSTLPTKDVYILWQQSWLNKAFYDPTLGDWRPRFMENDTDFYTLHPRLRDFLDYKFSDTEVIDFDDPDIQFYMALCYVTEFGVVNDLEKQIEYCIKAATNGHLEAQLSLAACYEVGASGVALDQEKAFYWYLKAAEAGDSGAQYQVAKCYFFGMGVDMNRNDSDNWRKHANDNGTQPLEIKFDFTLSLLHRAAENGQVDLVSSLIGREIEQGSVRATINDRQGRTPLHLAAEKGHIEVVKLLAIEFNAEINAVDEANRTPLHLAASNGHTEVVRLLVTVLEADFRTKDKDKDGRTLLHVAAAGGIEIDVIRLLVDRPGDYVNADIGDKKGWTPLHWAAQNGHIDVMKMLVTKLEANPNTKDNNGRTPLHVAAENGHFEAMEMLVAELGADKDEKDNNGGTLLHYAVKGGLHPAVKGSTAVDSHIDVMSLLVAKRATGINLEDNRGQTLLHWAVQGGQVEAMKQLMLKLLPTELSFEDNGIRAEGARVLAESLKQNTTLTNLNLKRNNIGAKGACALAVSLKQNMTLTNLNLEENEIGGKGTHALAESLKWNTTLTNLNLTVNNIGAEGACALAESLKHKTTLIKLNLKDNEIGTEGAHALAESLKQNTTLIELNLTVNNIGIKGACALAESLKHNTTLTRLNLEDNEISDEGARALAESLKQNTTLTNLNLRGNKIGAKGACALAESLKQNTILTELNLEGNIIGDEGTRTLSESLKQNMTLTELNFEMVGHNTVLAELLKRNKNLEKLFAIIKLDMANNGGTQLCKRLTEFERDKNANGGLTPLHVIVAYRHIELLKLVEEFKSNADSQDSNGWTPLHMATARGYYEVVKQLVTELGANPNAKDADEKTPLHRAAENGHVDVVKLLATDHEADITVKDKDGYTPLHWATRFEHIDVMKLLVTEFKVNINITDNDECTPLHRFAQAWFFEIMDVLMAEFGTDINAGANASQISLDWAVTSKKVEMMKLFVPELGTDATIRAKVEPKAIQYRVRDWYVKIARQLVTEHGANFNAKVDREWYVNVIKLLVVKHDANVEPEGDNAENVEDVKDAENVENTEDARDAEDAKDAEDEEGVEKIEELGPSSNDGDSEREPQRGSDDDGLIWKATVAVVSVGAVICIAWLLWGRMSSRRRLRRP